MKACRGLLVIISMNCASKCKINERSKSLGKACSNVGSFAQFESLHIQGVPWQRASGIGLLQACFRTSEVPKGVIVTPRVGANYI